MGCQLSFPDISLLSSSMKVKCYSMWRVKPCFVFHIIVIKHLSIFHFRLVQTEFIFKFIYYLFYHCLKHILKASIIQKTLKKKNANVIKVSQC